MPGKRFDLEFIKGTLQGKRARFVSMTDDSRVRVELQDGPTISATWGYLRKVPQRSTRPKTRGEQTR